MGRDLGRVEGGRGISLGPGEREARGPDPLFPIVLGPPSALGRPATPRASPAVVLGRAGGAVARLLVDRNRGSGAAPHWSEGCFWARTSPKNARAGFGGWLGAGSGGGAAGGGTATHDPYSPSPLPPTRSPCLAPLVAVPSVCAVRPGPFGGGCGSSAHSWWTGSGGGWRLVGCGWCKGIRARIRCAVRSAPNTHSPPYSPPSFPLPPDAGLPGFGPSRCNPPTSGYFGDSG